MSFTFRSDPLPQDVAAVHELCTATGFFRPDEVEVATELVEERLAKGQESGYYFWFAEAGGKLAGYVCFGDAPCSLVSWDLYWIAVSPSLQGSGLGRILQEKCMETARLHGGRRLFVDTAGKAQYAPTREFYLRTGYREAARLRDYYDIGDDKVIYEKDL